MTATSTVVDSVVIATFTFYPIKSRTYTTNTNVTLAKALNFWRFEGRRGGTLSKILRQPRN